MFKENGYKMKIVNSRTKNSHRERIMSSIFLAKRRRFLTHLLLAFFTVAGCYIAFLLKSDARLVRQLTLGFGYVSLILLMFTLLIGPWKVLRQHRNPVSINLRRDVGIWAGISGVLHVLFGFQVHMKGQVLLYFLKPDGEVYKPLLNLFGMSNYIGAIATLILLLLLALSNDLSLRWLKRRRWKFLQRFNYLSFILVLAHTLSYQVIAKREYSIVVIVLGLTSVVFVMQSLGFFLYGRMVGDVK